MRQVNRDELLFNLTLAISRFPAALLRDLSSRETERRRAANGIAAGIIADMMSRYEILSSAPLNHPAGDALFETAAQRRERGVAQPSGTAIADG